MVVAVTGLGLAARMHHVDLGGDLIERPEPGPADQCQDRVGVIAREQVRRLDAQLLMGVPDPGIGAGGRKMVAGSGGLAALGLHDPMEDVRDPVDQAAIVVGPAEDDRARPGVQHRVPFGHVGFQAAGNRPGPGGCGRRRRSAAAMRSRRPAAPFPAGSRNPQGSGAHPASRPPAPARHRDRLQPANPWHPLVIAHGRRLQVRAPDRRKEKGTGRCRRVGAASRFSDGSMTLRLR